MAAALSAGGATIVAAAQQSASDEPALCFESLSESFDASAWAGLHDTVVDAVAHEPDFLPDAIVVTLPGPGDDWDTGDYETLRLGVWTPGAGEALPLEHYQDTIATYDCRTTDATWGAHISQKLMIDGAERILAQARLPDESGEPPIPENATAEIAIELDSVEDRIRTLLRFDVPVAFIRLGGTCWIDDTPTIDGDAVWPGSLEARGRDTDGLAASGCDRFDAFMTEGGIGRQVLRLLPDELTFDDGSTLRLQAISIDVEPNALLLTGEISQ